MLESPFNTVPLRKSLAAGSIFAVLFTCVSLALFAQSSKKKADSGKLLLDPPKDAAQPVDTDLPNAVAAETSRLTFQVSPLSGKGLLLQQTRDALKAIMDSNHGGRIVKLRAFVAGTGDARRIRQIVTDVFVEKKKPLPALTTVLAGELPKDGAQVVIESVSEQSGGRPANPEGLVFLSSQRRSDAEAALKQFAADASAAGVRANNVLRVTCFLGSVSEATAATAKAAQDFPAAAFDAVQTLRAPVGSSATCEGVARGKGVSAPKLVFTGAQMAFGEGESDLRLAMERLQKTLQALGANYGDVVFAGFYPVGRSTEEKLLPLAAEFFHTQVPSTAEIFESLPSPDATVSVEVVAAVRN